MTQINPIAAETVRIFLMRKGNVHVPLDFKLVAKIGLSVALASCLGLLLVLFPVLFPAGAEKGVDYRQIVGAYGSARQAIGPAMLVFGLVMVGFAGITTWLFSLYTSFRIAGPLFRISRNLETQIEQGPVVPTPVRTTDSLQDEAQAFAAGVAALRAQHEELRQALAAVERIALSDARAEDVASLRPALARLKKAERRVRL